MSIELIINRLIGQTESGNPEPLSQVESRALSQRLRALVGAEAGEEGAAGLDRGAAAEALQLAAYLDGGMNAAERATFERDLVRSPERRDELMDAAAWLDALAAHNEMPPAEVNDLVMAMDTPAAPPQSTSWSERVAAFLERLLPRRLALATSALASIAIAVVAVDVALHLTTTQVSPPAVNQQADQQLPPIRTMLPPGQSGHLLLTAETINALQAYLQNPTDALRADVLRCLGRAGAPAFPNVGSIAIDPRLAARLRQRDGTLPTAIAVSMALDGTLRVEGVD